MANTKSTRLGTRTVHGTPLRALNTCLVLLALVAVACAPDRLDPKGTLHVSAMVSPNDREALRLAADEWHQGTHGRVDLSFADGDELDRLTRGHASPGAIATTHCTQDGVDITIDVSTPADAPVWALRQILAHELGHAFGLEHVRDPGSLMSDAPNAGQWCLDAGTLERFCEAWNCPNGYEPVCVTVPVL